MIKENNMKRLYIGDIHGDYKVVEYINKYFKEHKKIFLGDILDSFYFSTAEQIESLDLIIKMIEEGNTQCLFGNHEMSYLYPKHFKCSGYKEETFIQFMNYREKVLTLFKPFIYDKKNKILR